MAYERLDPAHEEQVREMRKDNKSPQEIADFFKATYKIKLPLWKISYICKKKNPQGGGSDQGNQEDRAEDIREEAAGYRAGS